MPYIAAERRKALDGHIENLQQALSDLGHSEGDLNYAISRLVGSVFLSETSYHTIARVTGVLDNVKSEFYRRLAIPYEDEAIEKNCDVLEFQRIETIIDSQRREKIAEVVTG